MIAGYGWDEVSVVSFKNGTVDSVGTQKRRLHVADAFVMDHVACEGYWDTNVYESNLCARVVNNRHDGSPRGICRVSLVVLSPRVNILKSEVTEKVRR